jgi:pyrroline-5-carboxylate reductase
MLEPCNDRNKVCGKIGFLGGGRITSILLAAWADGGICLKDVVVSDSDPDVLAKLKARFPEIGTVMDNRLSVEQEVVFLSLHPSVAKTVLPDLAKSMPANALFVSLAPGLDFGNLSGLLGGFTRLARLIPNAPSMVHRGFNPFSFGPGVSKEDRALLVRLFCPLGEYLEVDESKLDAYAILSAMGPTYFWFQWQVLRDLAESFGLESQEADRALLVMLHGAVALMFEQGLEYGVVNDMVPVKPLAEGQEAIEHLFREKLGAVHARLKG